MGRLLPAFLAISVLPAVLPAQTNRISGRIDNRQTVMLAGRVHPLANATNDRGRVAADFALPGMTLLLKPTAQQQTALQQFTARQEDPASPDFHRWLSPEQYADRFAASASDLSQIEDWLKSEGFTVTNVARSRTFISFRG